MQTNPAILTKTDITPTALAELKGKEVLVKTVNEGFTQTATAIQSGSNPPVVSFAVVKRVSPSGEHVELANNHFTAYWIPVASIEGIEVLE